MENLKQLGDSLNNANLNERLKAIHLSMDMDYAIVGSKIVLKHIKNHVGY
jgi:hypothetical protein